MISKNIEFGYQKHADWMGKALSLDGKSMEIEIHPPCAG